MRANSSRNRNAKTTPCARDYDQNDLLHDPPTREKKRKSVTKIMLINTSFRCIGHTSIKEHAQGTSVLLSVHLLLSLPLASSYLKPITYHPKSQIVFLLVSLSREGGLSSVRRGCHHWQRLHSKINCQSFDSCCLEIRAAPANITNYPSSIQFS